MPHIALPPQLPGVLGLLAFKPSVGTALAGFIQQLLRGDSSLSAADRELLAAYVSRLHECEFCNRSHAAAARALGADATACAAVTGAPEIPDGSPRLQALFRLAAAVVPGGHGVTAGIVADARAAGAGDEDIHDTVLIAAAFCMLTRYVDGLDTAVPPDNAAYDLMGERLARKGYPVGPQ